ncbi:restriction endonuclease [Algoriphagus sp. H41]|uniref:Restriction endonuclease n=1 Tax=Algoriphagus oliviformis TaxID=2811231 RepID=A0ABS3BY05_9BACT|nr:restriction endonuclease [Algoriphagus oliviformis]MBN7809535.1 restriction endonuclease [Algoriphagus oliviformis]
MKKISATAVNALKIALTTIYWYKSDLRSFFDHTISNKLILSYLDWNDYKRNICSRLVDLLVKNEEKTQNDLLKLVYEICNMNDFTHLRQLDDGEEKEKNAKEAVNALRKVSQGHLVQIKEQEEIENRRKKVFHEQLKKTAVREKLEETKIDFYALLSSSDPQKRGYQLEKLLKDLFNLFDLDSKASFKIVGEQIDGMFTFENNDFLLEAKWHKDPIDISSLDSFSGKLGRRLENTLGLFISINGFSPDAIQAHSAGRKLMILMDGSDLMAVLEGRIDLIQLLARKRRYAAQTGNIFLGIHEIMKGI